MNNIINSLVVANNSASGPLGWPTVNMLSARYHAAKRAGIEAAAKIWRVQQIEGGHIDYYCILAVMVEGHAPFAGYFYPDGEVEDKVASLFGIVPSDWVDIEQFYG